ncbi:LysR substrate-binding domain-containing protein [Rhodococcus jostii]|uniref:DNA-binding transcriptional regulator, LysR family n=1 Tax=Rhodococcus jostii TaxID=132919 RepID=A0A1H5MME9_RHOJO|nr:LysR substrate-binding domain-containing protein [Rhodococcus jostii]SEE89578.1 DNA-binding transcriptional regulator, LysR family [Rhodococcus jostii]
MEFRHIVSFITIAEELHFGRAASRLHLTQPSLSAQLQKLEKSLGVRLVARTSHEVKLTSAGREFEAQARLIVTQMEKAARIARATADGRSGALSIGYNMPASRHVLPSALAKMSAVHPDVVVSLWEKRTGPQLADLADGTLDIALVYGHPRTADFRYRRVLRRIPLVAVVGKGHAWAGRAAVPFAELATQECVMFSRDQCPAMYDSIFGAASDSRISLDVVQTADDPGATAHMVSVKPLVGFASLPRASSGGLGAMGANSVAVKLFDPIPTIDLYAVWRSVEVNPAVFSFLDCVDNFDELQRNEGGLVAI